MRILRRASILVLITAGTLSPAIAQTPDDPERASPELLVQPGPAAGPQHRPAQRKPTRRRPARRAPAARSPHVDQFREAEKHGFRKVNDLLPAFPPFYPGLGIVTVDPKTLPMGPFRCFDRAGDLVATVYMPTMADMEAHKTWDKVPGVAAPVDHVTQYFHPGHPGVPMAHYHVVLWHVKNEAVVAR